MAQNKKEYIYSWEGPTIKSYTGIPIKDCGIVRIVRLSEWHGSEKIKSGQYGSSFWRLRSESVPEWTTPVVVSENRINVWSHPAKYETPTIFHRFTSWDAFEEWCLTGLFKPEEDKPEVDWEQLPIEGRNPVSNRANAR